MNSSVFDLRLRNFPTYAKALIAGYLVTLGLGYCYAMANIVLVVGLTPKEIAIHYAGSATPAQPPAGELGEQEFSLDEVEPTPTAVAYSLKNLVAEGHFHLFGMSSFFFGLCVIGLFLDLNPTPKAYVLSLPFIGIILDNLSFAATRFLGPSFSYLTVVAGSLMALNFLVLWVLIARDLFRKAVVSR